MSTADDEQRLRRFFADDELDGREQAALTSVRDAVAARDFAGSGTPRGGRVVALAGGVSLMVASGAVAVVVLRQHGSTRVLIPAGPTPTPSTANLPPERGELVNPPLTAVKMVGALDGWGWNSRKLYRTLDGGSSWSAITASGLGNIGADTPILSFDAVDADHAWVVISEGIAGSEPPDAMVWRTLDGGKVWEGVGAPRGNGRITMLSTTTGFIFTGESGAAGSEAVAIVRTTDGANWSLMSETPAGAASAAAGAPGVPFSCSKTGAGFVNAGTGWVTGSCGDSAVLFLVTHDGGVRWKPQTLASPPRMKVVSLQPPVFLDGSEGYLVARGVDISGATQDVPVLYRTHDGGSSWSAQRAAPPGCSDAAAVDAGAAVCVQGNGTVFRIEAGGDWTAVATHPELANASVALMFLRGPQSPGAGFGYLFAVPSSSTTGQGVLYRTTDSGRTLTHVSG